MKYLILIPTLMLHFLIAMFWGYCTGVIGLILMFGHWFLFNGCCITHLERWVHIKLIGESVYPDTWTKCLVYKWIYKTK